MIHSIEKIRDCILDPDDGSCRDFNFVSTNRLAVVKLIAWFYENYHSFYAFDNDGIEQKYDSMQSAVINLQNTNSIQIGCESSSCIIKQIQIFIYEENDNSVFVEISFFPHDINHEVFEIQPFLQLIKLWHTIANSDKGYLRYENASWKFGDVTKYSGVFYVSK